MKRKLMSVMLMVLIVCLSASMLILSACNGDNNGKKTSTVTDTHTMFTQVLDKLGSGISENFSIDVAAEFVSTDNKNENNTSTFSIIGKGNVDVKESASEDATNFMLELNKMEGEQKQTIFGLAYEYIDGAPYFFINIANGGYAKINGVSVVALYQMLTAPEASTSAVTDELPIDKIIIQTLFGEEGNVANGVYTFNFDLVKTMLAVKSLLPTVAGLIGLTEADINGIIATVFGDLSYTDNDGQTVNVNSFDTLTTYVVKNIRLTGKVEFSFSGNTLNNATASFDYATSTEADYNYTLNVNKAVLGTVSEPIDTFAGFALTTQERAAAVAKNLLNFQINGIANSYTTEEVTDKINKSYSISLNADINPMPLLKLLQSTEKSAIVNVLKELGYFNLTIDEIDKVSGAKKANIITIHSKFDEGFAVVNFDLHDAPLSNYLAVGGVYDFDALIDIIGMLSNPASTVAEEEGGFDIMGIVKSLFANLVFDNVSENGVTLKLRNVFDDLLDSLGMGDDSMIKIAVGSALSQAKAFNIKVYDTTFGACEAVETTSIENTIRKVSDFANKDFIKEIKSINNFGIFEQGVADYDMIVGDREMSKFYSMTGINLKGEEVSTTGYILGSTIDPNKAGEQDITVYVGIGHEIYKTIGSMGLDDMIPLYGVIPFKTTVKVMAVSKDATVTSTIKTIETAQIAENLFDKVLTDGFAIMTINSENVTRSYRLDGSAISVFKGTNDVTKTILDAEGNIIMGGGTYSVRLSVGGNYVEMPVVITGNIVAFADKTSIPKSMLIGSTFSADMKPFFVDADGNINEIENATGPVFKIGSSTKKEEDVFDVEMVDGKKMYTLKKNGDHIGKDLSIIFKIPDPNNSGKTIDTKHVITLTILETDPSNMAKGSYTSYPGAALGMVASFTMNGIVYEVSPKEVNQDGTPVWQALDADGNAYDGEFEFTVTRNSDGEPLKLNQNKMIINTLNENKSGSRSTRFNYTLTVNGFYLTSYFNAQDLYASNITSRFTTNHVLSGRISSVGYIEHYDAQGEKVKLEFKYVESLDKYAITIVGTDTVAYDVAMTVTNTADDSVVKLVNGKFAQAGTYKVQYTVTINNIVNTFFHTVKVDPAA